MRPFWQSRVDAQGRWWRSFPVRGPRRSHATCPRWSEPPAKLAQERPGVRFAVACLHERHKILAEGIIARTLALVKGRGPSLLIEVHAGRTPELIRLARVAWAVSGSVGLELMVEALAFGRALQDQAVRSLGGSMVHQVEVHQPGESHGRRRGVSRVLDVARRLGRAGPMGVGMARRFRGTYPGDSLTCEVANPRCQTRCIRPRGPAYRRAGCVKILRDGPATRDPALQDAYRGPHEPGWEAKAASPRRPERQ